MTLVCAAMFAALPQCPNTIILILEDFARAKFYYPHASADSTFDYGDPQQHYIHWVTSLFDLASC